MTSLFPQCACQAICNVCKLNLVASQVGARFSAKWLALLRTSTSVPGCCGADAAFEGLRACQGSCNTCSSTSHVVPLKAPPMDPRLAACFQKQACRCKWLTEFSVSAGRRLLQLGGWWFRADWLASQLHAALRRVNPALAVEPRLIGLV